MYASNGPAGIMFSASPVVHNINGMQNYRAVMCLIALTGNYDIPGAIRQDRVRCLLAMNMEK